MLTNRLSLRWLLTLVSCALLVSLVPAWFTPRPLTANTQDAATLTQAVIELTNAERAAHGLPPLKFQPNLHEAAMWIAADNASIGQLNHTDTLGRSIGQRFPAFGYSGYSRIGENLAAGYATPAAAIAGWMDSPGHRANILNPNFCELGVGYVYDEATSFKRFWSQNFGCRFDVYPIIINREAASTNSTAVELYIYGSGWAQELRLSNDGVNWSDWEGYQAERNWVLEAGHGMRTVYVELRRDGVVRTSSDTIMLHDSSPSETATATRTATALPTATPIQPGDPTPTVGPIETATPTQSPTPERYTITGRVTTSAGEGLADVRLSAGTHTALSAGDGSYTLENLPAGSYTLTPSRSGYSFSPAERTVNLSSNLSDQDFTATADPPIVALVIHGVSPQAGANATTTTITVRGSGFATSPAPSARLSNAEGQIALTTTTALNSSSFTALVPAGLAAGSYDIIVSSNGRTASLNNAFNVVAGAPELIQLNPTSAFNDLAIDLFIEGRNFAQDAVAQLGDEQLATTWIDQSLLVAEVPAGLTPATYDLRVSNPDGTDVRLSNAFSVIDPASDLNDDLLSSSDQLWLDPLVPQANRPVQMGLIVQRTGGKQALEDIEVLFRRDGPEGPELGRGVVNFLDPRSSDSTTPINVTFSEPGEVTIYAIIDPDNQVPEHNEANNVVQRTVLVAPLGPDRIPPVVQSIAINGGSSAAVSNPQLSIDISASDPAPGSGVDLVHIIEYFYSEAAQRWLPINRSGWLPFAENPTSYNWRLQPLAGMRYIQVRARDEAGNISIGNARRLVNYEIATDRIARNQTRIYRYEVEPGQSFEVNLEVLEGDADLYVWSSRAEQSAWVSNLSGSVNERVFIAANAVVPGLYQVEVYGYSAAEYRLNVAFGATTASLASGGIDEQKAQPGSPVLPLSSMPDANMGSVPNFIPELEQRGHTVYLPLVRR